jgi:hypothetical protein
MYAETEGNPFFVGEVLRHLVETGGVRREGDRWVVRDDERIDVPEGVRDVVGRRLNRLSATANEVLSVAAVVGRDFDIELVLGVVDGPEDATLDALDEGVRARLVEELDTDHLRFAHALVRTTLYEELSATRRRRLHRRIADVLEKLRPDDVRALALHCTEAGPDGGDLTRALRYTIAAAEEALAARAFADANTRFRAALELLEDTEDLPSPLWVVARCGLGECLRDEGDPSFREVLLEASRRALELGDVDLVLRAVLNNTRGFAAVVSGIDPERIELIEAALEVVGNTPSASRARLLAQLASELTFSNQDERRLALSDEAEAMARAIGDDRLLCDVLVMTGYAAMTGDRIPQLVERTAESTRLADAFGDPAQRVIARVFLGGALFALGDFDRLEEVTDTMVAVAEAEGSPLARWIATANSVRSWSLRGDLAGADATNDRAMQMSLDLGQGDGVQWWSATALAHAWVRGTIGTLVEQATDFADQYPLGRIWRCAEAWCLVDAGRLDEAHALVERYQLDPRELVVNSFPYAGCFQLAIVALATGDAALGAQVVEALEPYADHWAHFFMFGQGPVAGAVGMGRLATGDLEGGIADLDRALDLVEVSGVELVSLPWFHLYLAQALRARGGQGDTARADELVDAAIAQAEEIDAPVMVERLRAVR